MKTFYKYKNGYLNIDLENIYLTSTGNWSETKSLKEKSFGESAKKTGKVIAIYLFLGVIIVAILASFLLVEKNILLKIASLLISIAGFFRVKKYFDTETGQRIFIPKKKIIKASIDDDGILINFKTIDNSNDIIHISNVEGNLKSIIVEINNKE